MAAKKLAQEGNSPIVFEKHDEVGIPVRCGEVLFDPYNFFEKDPPGSRVKIDQVLVKLSHLHVLPAGDTGVWVMDKDRWLQSMASEVESLGGRILVGTQARISNLRKEFDFVLDCSGCPSQSKTEYHLNFDTMALGIQYTVNADVGRLLGKLFFQYVPGEVGSRWIFPKSAKEANVGMGWAHDAPVEKWRSLNEFASEQLGDYKILRKTTGCIPIGVRSNLLLENVLLCGDAAGLVNSYYAGGIHNALLSGALAAECLVEGKPELYEERLLSIMWGELAVAKLARSLLESSYRYHEKLVTYFGRNLSLGQMFSEETYRKLFPFIQIWNLRCHLLGRQRLQAFNRSFHARGTE